MQVSISDCLCIKVWNACRVCQGFITVNVAGKGDMLLTWLKEISCFTTVYNFLQVCLDWQWSRSFLYLLLSDSSFFCNYLALERDWHPEPYGGWAIAQGLSHLSCLQVGWLWCGGGSKRRVETQNAQISSAIQATSYLQLLFRVAHVIRSKYMIPGQLRRFMVAPWKIKYINWDSERKFSPIVLEMVGADIKC